MKRILRVLVIALLGLSLFALQAALSTVYAPSSTLCSAEEQQKVVARVNGVPITERELEQAMDTYVPPGSYHGSIGGQKREQYRKPALDMLTERELLHQEGKARGLKVSEREVDKALEEIKKPYKTKKAFDKALKDTGLTLDEYRNVVKRNLLIEKVLKVEVDDKSKYSDKALESYYNANKGKFLRPEVFKVRHILLKVPASATEDEKKEKKDKAMDLLKKIKEGADFGELAYKNSEDDYRVKGGDLGWVHKGRLEPAFEEVAFKLKVGDSAIAETGYGYHIVKLEDKKPAAQLTFAEVKDSLRKELESKKQQELREALMAKLKEKGKIEIY